MDLCFFFGGMMKFFVRNTDSTNRVAREKAATGATTGLVVWAEEQASGRGQYGRVFASPIGGLYFSLLLRPTLEALDLPLITLVTGLACRDVLFEECGVGARIKWPNDLYLGDKKVGGILCESSFDSGVTPGQPTVVIGVGININSHLSAFPPELRSLVTTIVEETDKSHNIEACLDCCVEKITAYVQSLSTNREMLLDRWRNYDYLLHRPVQYINGDQTVYGSGLGLASDGRYRILEDSGRERAIIGGQLRPADLPNVSA